MKSILPKVKGLVYYRKETGLVILSLLISHTIWAQVIVDPISFDYTKVDSIALSFSKQKNTSCSDVALSLTANLNSEHEKFRVIFRWITENIEYCYSNRSYKPGKALKKGKAVCIGYSTLLNEMARSVGIECQVISGYSKTEISDIPKLYEKTDHAWNAVKLYGKWYLVDVTWASGYYDKKTREFDKSYIEFYYLTDPHYFIKSHLPKQKKWQLLDTIVSRGEFSKQFVYYSGFFDKKIYNLFPSKGKIKVKQYKDLELEFSADSNISSVIIALDKDKYVYAPKIVKLDSCYKVKQQMNQSGIFEMILFFNNKGSVLYKLDIIKAKARRRRA